MIVKSHWVAEIFFKMQNKHLSKLFKVSSSQYLVKHEILKFHFLKFISRYPLDVVRRRMQLAGAVSDGYKYR